METNKLHLQLSTRKSLLDQGYLDEQFIELEDLEDETNPNFVEEMVASFYADSARHIYNTEQLLSRSPINFDKLDDHMYQFKGSSSSIGAKKVTYKCWRFRMSCRERNLEGCITAFNQMKQELATLRTKLEAYFQLLK